MKRLQELLGGTCPSYLTPLFWLHGEDEQTLRHMIQQMQGNGIGSFVVESRPHPDFLGEQWWRDIDVILDEAKRHGMKVWFFDDHKFPSGFSAGKIRDKHPSYLKRYLAERHLDAVGPQTDISVYIDAWIEEGEELVAVIAARRTDGNDTLDYHSITDITHHISEGILLWDIPEGDWRIFIMVDTRNGGEEHTRDYLNPLEPEPVQALLDYVYQPHYDRYKEDFGKTIAGFFTDEARFGNAESYDLILGQTSGYKGYNPPKIVLPWSATLMGKLNAGWQGDFKKVLPLLWYDADLHHAAVRYTYMDIVSQLFACNYTQKIGDWCRAHHVKYMGHLIEENGAHARLGYGTGHFFRTIRGQDYPGLDLIHQVWPGVTAGRFSSQVGYLDAEFFYWGITKMASSAAHIAAKNSGVTICEIFGAYGWQAGLKLMKWLTDHICVRGVNHLVPHAFTPTACDWDAPPHFYDRGYNPQWRYFSVWADYANRVCHLLNDGTHVATAAVLYHAEAEWAGKCMPFEKPVMALLRRQIDCDVVPADIFIKEKSAYCEDGYLKVGGEKYSIMIIPYAEMLSEEILDALNSVAQAGVPVIFIQDLPTGSPLPTERFPQIIKALKENPQVKICDCNLIPDEILKRNLQDVSLSSMEQSLRCYHYSHRDAQLYFLTNESINRGVQTTITLNCVGIPVFYDAMDNIVSYPEYTVAGDKLIIPIDLDAWQSRFIVVLENEEAVAIFRQSIPASQEGNMRKGYCGQEDQVNFLTLKKEGWTVSASKAPAVTDFQQINAICGLGNVAEPNKMPYFTGTIRYEKCFSVPEISTDKEIMLDLGRVYETAEVWINDHRIGSCITPPYCFRVKEYLTVGNNKIRIDVTNTLAKERGRNLLDRDMVQEPTGLIGPVRLFMA